MGSIDQIETVGAAPLDMSSRGHGVDRSVLRTPAPSSGAAYSFGRRAGVVYQGRARSKAAARNTLTSS
jgi:hypothetical protein